VKFRGKPVTPSWNKPREIRPPRNASSPSSRGRIDRSLPNKGLGPRIPDVNSGRRISPYSSRVGSWRRDKGSEHSWWLPPPPPPPPLPGHVGWHYWRDVRRHFDRYADYWFGGAPSWRVFIHTCEPAPWFWSHYSYVYTCPWVFGYYEPGVFVHFGWGPPIWAGRVYYPWWDWCDAPFVYYFYQYPARFSFSFSITDYDYYDDIYDGDVSVVVSAVERPVGLWVPGHWEPRTVVGTEWVWVPGYYIY